MSTESLDLRNRLTSSSLLEGTTSTLDGSFSYAQGEHLPDGKSDRNFSHYNGSVSRRQEKGEARGYSPCDE
jgi:hypothetical protein